MFNTTVPPTENPFLTITWNIDNKPIIASTSSTNNTAPGYEGRITLFISTGSLELRNLALSDSGEYRVTIVTQEASQLIGSIRLEVLEPVSNVVATANDTDLVEYNNSVRLSCSSSGSSLSFLWLNSSSEVTASDRVQLTDGNSTLTIVSVTRYDQGPFICKVSNPVSTAGGSVNLSISYGPENIKLIISLPQEHHEEGSNIVLSCSADSRPAALFYWFLNGDKMPDTGPELKLMNIQMNHSGNYSCQAFNEKTLRYETSQSSAVSVQARVANVVVTPNTTDLVEFNNSVRLSCSSSGSSRSFLWLNSSSEVTASDRVQLTDGDSTLTIVSVTRYDQGPFMCNVSNPVSTDTSGSVLLSISYGPENIKLIISPPQEHHEEGSNIVLSCSADSRPAALFYWFLNGDKLSDTGPELKLPNIQMSQGGNYSCRAFNEKTLRYETSQSSVVSVQAGPDITSSCSAGCIAGIVIACLVVCGAAAGGGGYYIYRKKKMAKTPIDRNTATITGRAGQDNTAYPGNQDVNYADIKFFQNRDGGRVQVGTQNDMSSQYAEVRMNSARAAGSSPPTYNAYMQQSKRLAPQPTGTQVYAEVRKN
ncbi:Carcinoembryonic antigen-related cell adhesion molecule 5 [Collichthys lucidus]|uniref:Carcinoembryonic antigen-related cell adhesion molecule 5 n=1 Tax=Collichthys lucidus TaxID=240159 RepID=A0A4U5V3F4_COLLU|nr:Carcinoembryonic antigen-related cell adhesion molecule 5 [Collichthys lucidus]